MEGPFSPIKIRWDEEDTGAEEERNREKRKKDFKKIFPDPKEENERGHLFVRIF